MVTVSEPVAPEISAVDTSQQAELWLLEARRAPFPENARLILQATDAYLESDNPELARQAFSQLPNLTLPPSLAPRAVLTEAALLLSENQPILAREKLNTLTMELPLDSLLRFHRLRAESYAQTGHHLEAARERIWLEAFITDTAAIADNQRAIWQSLNRLSSTALIQLRTQPAPDVLSGWMELVLITRGKAQDPEALQLALQDWRGQYHNHPADLAVLQTFFNQTLRITPHPEHIAVLLPLSGSYRSAGEAIRNGILTAHYAQPGATSELRFYDTGADPNRTWTLYQEAVAAGAQAVIGPLTKPEVTEIARAGILTVPVLALNRADPLETNPYGLFQFALAPEDEAREVAEELKIRGHQRVLLLTPANPWGERLTAEFQLRLAQLGGELLEVQRYSDQTRDRSNQVKSLMNIDLSEDRQNRLTRLLGSRSEYEPRRRQDADAIVLFAQPEDARLTRPLFRFHLASDLPVYATSHVYQGQFNLNDADMNGLMFCDMPWLLDSDERTQRLRNSLTSAWPAQAASLPRLQAFGVDAYDILPYLNDLYSGQRQAFSGVTGLLTVNAQQWIERDLPWAEFRRGQPRLLAPVMDNRQPGLAPTLKDEPHVWQQPLPTAQTGPAS